MTHNTAKRPPGRIAEALGATASSGSHTTNPVEKVDCRTPLSRPEFLRLPQGGCRCPHTGLSRSALNALILPTPENDFLPPVRSFVLRKRGARTGIRLIDFDSLTAYIRAHVQEEGNSTEEAFEMKREGDRP
jgi:hypothetical protein